MINFFRKKLDYYRKIIREIQDNPQNISYFKKKEIEKGDEGLNLSLLHYIQPFQFGQELLSNKIFYL